MAIELNVGSVRTALTTETNLAEDLGVAQKGTLTPVLSGDSLKVTSGEMTDLEKLVARLKNEDENVRQSVSQRRVAILQTVLDSLADRISAADKAKVLELEELNGQKTAAEEALSGLKCAAARNRRRSWKTSRSSTTTLSGSMVKRLPEHHPYARISRKYGIIYGVRTKRCNLSPHGV